MKTLQIKVLQWQDKVWDDLLRGSVSSEMYRERKRGDREYMYEGINDDQGMLGYGTGRKPDREPLGNT